MICHGRQNIKQCKGVSRLDTPFLFQLHRCNFRFSTIKVTHTHVRKCYFGNILHGRVLRGCGIAYDSGGIENGGVIPDK